MDMTMKEKAVLRALLVGNRFRVRYGMYAPYSFGYMAEGEELINDLVTTKREWWKYLPGIVVKDLENNGWTIEDFEKLSQESLEQFSAQNSQNTKTQSLPVWTVTGYENLSKEDAQKVIDGYAGESSCILTSQEDLARLLFRIRWHGKIREPKRLHESYKKCIDDLAGILDS